MLKTILKVLCIGILAIIIMSIVLPLLVTVIGGFIGVILVVAVIVGLFTIVKKLL